MLTVTEKKGLEEIINGQRFNFKGYAWIGFTGNFMPPEMKGKAWTMLRADGQTFDGNSTAWTRSRLSINRVVGYKFDGMEEQPVRETFLHAGSLWWKRSDPVGVIPLELAGVTGSNWAYVYDEGYVCIGMAAPGNDVYFQGPRIVGYRVIPPTEERPIKMGPFGPINFNPPTQVPIRRTFEAHGFTWFDCSADRECPEELKNTKGGDWDYMFGVYGNSAGMAMKSAGSACYADDWKRGLWFKAFRLIKKVGESSVEDLPQAPVATLVEIQKLNQPMIARDGQAETAAEKHTRMVKAMAGDGNIFPKPKPFVHPLYRVAPITGTGFSLWGTDHFKE